jgi:hypothetical protein
VAGGSARTSGGLDRVPDNLNEVACGVDQVPGKRAHVACCRARVPRRLDRVTSKLDASPGRLNASPGGLNRTPGRVNRVGGGLDQVPVKVAHTPGKLDRVPDNSVCTPCKLDHVAVGVAGCERVSAEPGVEEHSKSQDGETGCFFLRTVQATRKMPLTVKDKVLSPRVRLRWRAHLHVARLMRGVRHVTGPLDRNSVSHHWQTISERERSVRGPADRAQFKSPARKGRVGVKPNRSNPARRSRAWVLGRDRAVEDESA